MTIDQQIEFVKDLREFKDEDMWPPYDAVIESLEKLRPKTEDNHPNPNAYTRQ